MWSSTNSGQVTEVGILHCTGTVRTERTEVLASSLLVIRLLVSEFRNDVILNDGLYL